MSHSTLQDTALLEGRTHAFAVVETFEDGSPRLFGTAAELPGALIMLRVAREGRLYERTPCGRWNRLDPEGLSLLEPGA